MGTVPVKGPDQDTEQRKEATHMYTYADEDVHMHMKHEHKGHVVLNTPVAVPLPSVKYACDIRTVRGDAEGQDFLKKKGGPNLGQVHKGDQGSSFQEVIHNMCAHF